MNLRLDTTDLYSGAVTVGLTGFGVLGQDIPASGDSGASVFLNDVTLPADNLVEVRGEIVTWPASGTFFFNEDGSFEFSGASDGTYYFTYKCFKDEVYVDTYSVSMVVGSIDSIGSATFQPLDLTTVGGLGNGTAVFSLNLIAAPSVTTALSQTTGVVQYHTIATNDNIGSSSSTTFAITQSHILTALDSVQTGDSSTPSISAGMLLVGTSVNSDAQSGIGSITSAHMLAISNSQGVSFSSNALMLGAVLKNGYPSPICRQSVFKSAINPIFDREDAN